jgi:hypothetical protein
MSGKLGLKGLIKNVLMNLVLSDTPRVKAFQEFCGSSKLASLALAL